MYRKVFKRVIDIVLSLVVIIVASPVILIIIILLIIANRGKPFFFQQRPGMNEVIFRVVKFKTMNDKTDSHGRPLPDAERLTATGSFIRRTSLDELPQLFNVLIGNMSLIGPRPLLVQYLPLYNATQRKRHDIKPGITGWAQINGRNAISWKQKFEYDVWYVEHCSFKLDLKILGRTISKVFRSEGITSGTSATMEVFNGN
jgi:lipopolysaccharide/colanic/teichoic acid biosynthesis glycosyltransferase